MAEKDSIQFTALSTGKFDQQEQAIRLLQQVKTDGQIQVVSVKCKELNQEPPLLYDLTTLQKEANSKLNFSADKTLSIAQKLYESKYICYPRTGSLYLSDDVFEEIPELLSLMQRHDRFAGYAEGINGKPLNRHTVNDAKVTDHHALIITENLPGELSSDERSIYDMIAGRMLEAFSPKCIKDVTTLNLKSGDVDFMVKGTVIKSAGWRAVYNDKEEGEENAQLPELADGDTLPLSGSELMEKQAKPKPLHTESSLLSAMESAGKELEDADPRTSNEKYPCFVQWRSGVLCGTSRSGNTPLTLRAFQVVLTV